MKNQTIASFMNIDEFIKNIAKELEEKHKVYPSVNVWDFKVKSKNEYYILSDIERVLKRYLNQ